MASGALPPAFPAVRIDGELYWDGGILSNTPTEAVFDDKPRKISVIFAVHMWNPTDRNPRQSGEVLNRQKDIQYSSRIATHIARQQQTHRLRHVISELVGQLPEHKRKEETIRELAAYGCPTRMHVVRLLAPMLERENHTKDIDFSASGVRQRWEAGYTHTIHVLEQRPWDGESTRLPGSFSTSARTYLPLPPNDASGQPERESRELWTASVARSGACNFPRNISNSRCLRRAISCGGGSGFPITTRSLRLLLRRGLWRAGMWRQASGIATTTPFARRGRFRTADSISSTFFAPVSNIPLCAERLSNSPSAIKLKQSSSKRQALA